MQASAGARHTRSEGVNPLFKSWKSRAAVFAVAATMAVPVIVLATPAGAAAGGNSANAKACQQGGYLDYATTTGTKFKNAGECTSYAANGGTLVPLPDLVPFLTCGPTAVFGLAGCELAIKNVGIAPANGQADLTLQVAAGADSCTINSQGLSVSLNPGASTPTLQSCGFSLATGTRVVGTGSLTTAILQNTNNDTSTQTFTV